MKKKMMLGSIIAVLITLLMTSSATAVTTNIDTNIKITKSLLPKLNDAYNSKDIDNKDFKILLGQIISLVQTKGTVNSNDIQKIINENNLVGILGVRFSRQIYTDSPDPLGRIPGGCGPHIFRFLYTGGFFCWRAVASFWPNLPISISVGPDTYTCNHEGLAISFFGTAHCDWTFDMTWGARQRFYAAGFGFLIFVASA